MNALKNFIAREDGQDLVEYALLAALLSIASIAALKVLGPKIAAPWGKISDELLYAPGERRRARGRRVLLRRGRGVDGRAPAPTQRPARPRRAPGPT